MKIEDRCQECKKDWTKCGTCPVMMKWVKEHKVDYSSEAKKIKEVLKNE